MKSILVIGMGRFGSNLAYKLLELKNEVVIVDSNAALVEEMASDFVDAHIGDCTSLAMLSTIGVNNFDVCFVCVGENFQSSLEITSNLKDLGAKRIVSKANKDIQAKFLLKIGADEVVYPEKQMAEKTAIRFSTSKNILDFIALTPDYAIYEIPVNGSWVGRSIAQVDIRRKYNINVLAIKNDNHIIPVPNADYVFSNNDILVVFGKSADVIKLTQKNW